jgi:hypothetical protein
LSFGYNEQEDRLALLGKDDQGRTAALLLTRRFTQRLINGLAGLLERTSPLAAQAPTEMRSDIVLIEHQGALSDPAKGPSTEAKRTAPPSPRGVPAGSLQLVVKINVKTTRTEFQMILEASKGPPVAMNLNRLDLHRFLDLLKRRADAADWNIQVGVPWLEPDQTHFVLN